MADVTPRTTRDAFAILAVAILSGCRVSAAPPAAREAPSLSVAGIEFDRDPQIVPRAEALEDVDQALYAFDQAYAGVDGLPRTPAPEALTLARSRITARGAVTPRAFVSLLRELFWQPDGHLAFGYGGAAPVRLPAKPLRSAQVSEAVIDRVDAEGRAWLPRGRLVGCAPREGDGLPASARFLPTPEGRFVLGLFGEPQGDALACHLESAAGARPSLLMLAMRASAQSPPQTSDAAIDFDDGDVPVLAVRTFDNAAFAAMEELPALARTLRASAGFVVDLRGNAGGNYGFAESFVLELTDAPLLRLHEREVVSIAAAEGRANAVRRRLAAADMPAAAQPRFAAELAILEQEASDLRAAGATRAEVVARGATVQGRAAGPLRSRAVFVVDSGCASACEMMIAMVRQIPGVIVVGTNTHGGMSVGELAMFRLRHSGIAITFGTRAFGDPLGDFDEGRGFLPDLWIGDGDPIAAAKRIARGSPDAPLRRGHHALEANLKGDLTRDGSTIPAARSR